MYKTDKNKIFIVFLAFLLILPMAGFAVTKPTDAQKKEMQNLINKTNHYQSQYDACRMMEAVSWATWNPVGAAIWAAAAAQYYIPANNWGDETVEKVDDYYDITAPPGCTVEYDPDCDDYAYVPYTTDKKNIKVVICPPALSDGPGLVASTKIHEMEHAWQVYLCFSSKPGFWKNCTWWGHWAERSAYDTEEYYYDKCVTSDMPKEEKDLIKERYKYHDNAMDSLPKPVFTLDNKKAFPGDLVQMDFVVYNTTGGPVTANLSFTDDESWTIIPPSFPGVGIPAEGEYTGSVDVQVLPGAAPWTVNPITIVADCGYTSGSYVSMIYIHPFVKLTPGSEQSANRSDSVVVDFEIQNESSSSEIFNITMTNPLGWATTFTSPTVAMTSGEIKTLTAQVDVPPEVAPWTTNLVFCEATAVSDAAQSNKKWVPILVNEKDIGALIVESPVGELDNGEVFTPKVVVRNGGHIDSFFDVTFEIPDFPAITETISVGSLAPGEMTTVTFGPQSIVTGGTFETKSFITLLGDADPENDVSTGTVTIKPASRVLDWNALMK